jgi:hypothetical protein
MEFVVVEFVLSIDAQRQSALESPLQWLELYLLNTYYYLPNSE